MIFRLDEYGVYKAYIKFHVETWTWGVERERLPFDEDRFLPRTDIYKSQRGIVEGVWRVCRDSV